MHTTASPSRKEHKYTSPLSTNCPVGKSPLDKTVGAREELGRSSQPSSHLSCSIIAAMPAGHSPMHAHREQLLHTTSNFYNLIWAQISCSEYKLRYRRDTRLPYSL